MSKVWQAVEVIAGAAAFVCLILASGVTEFADFFWPVVAGVWFGMLSAVAHMKLNPPRD